jgi:hypothetical protein
MLGRRSEARFVVANNESVLRVARDVTVIAAGREFVVISHEPAAVGDALTIEMLVGSQVAQVAVRVEDSSPIIVAGVIRHRIRLSRLDPAVRAI